MCREQCAHWQTRVQGHNQLEKQTKKSMCAMQVGRGLRDGAGRSNERLRDKISVQVDAANGVKCCMSFCYAGLMKKIVCELVTD